MRRWLYGYRYVVGTPATLEEVLLHRSMDLLRAATGSEAGSPAADGSCVVELRSTVAGVEMAKKVRVATGVAHRVGNRVILPLTWHADGGPQAFPAFEGSLELEDLDEHTAQLTLVGSYRAPLGPIGAVADAVLLRTVGQATADALVGRLADELGRAAGDPRPEHVAGPRVGAPLEVGDVMTSDPMVIDAELPLRTAALLLFHWEVSAAPVVTATGELVGVLSEGDLLVKEATRSSGFDRRSRREDPRRAAHTAGEACTRPARTTVPGALLTHAARAMLDEDVNRLVVVDGGRIAGIVSRHDVLAALLRADADIELAVRRVVAMHAGSGVDVAVEWGAVTLSGSTELRSAARRLPAVVGDVDGVMTVDAEVEWDFDDEMLPLTHL